MSIVYEKSSNKSVEEAITSVKENLKKQGFGVLWELDFKKTLESKGLEFENEYVVLEVCDPKQAKTILEEDMQAGYTLPCKMAVRREDNKTYIGLMSPKTLLGLFDNSKLAQIGKEVEDTLKTVIEASV